MIIRLRIQAQRDREALIVALVNSGYKVWVEEIKDNVLHTTYYVCIDKCSVEVV